MISLREMLLIQRAIVREMLERRAQDALMRALVTAEEHARWANATRPTFGYLFKVPVVPHVSGGACRVPLHRQGGDRE